ncbi:helix-turn-helix transcriptional regulator [Compostimonas suwonensis]|uniref:Regulatory LuxR family protein n=1 Tax=Compostimonas suwonensis TaxID=1048394 RepID=A0A2M9BB37_9MICO|nr:helix-turn-helix transcriptional regulator [Compostimonas suwonensis]PJJ55153.1 regulatory LuxR family protein [Compostimonas suwonensis]
MPPTTSTSLIGREKDLAALADALAESRTGSARTVVVSGEAGVGKTRLLTEFIRSIPVGGPSSPAPIVVRGQCVDLDRDAPPYAPVIAALRALAATIGEEAFLEAAGPARDALAVLLPELRDRAQTEATQRGSAERLFEAVAAVLENVSRERPIVVVVEDLHWSDQATLALLRFLVRVVEDARVLLVVTFRSDDLGRGHPLRAWRPELDRNRKVVRLELQRLNRRQVRQLVGSLVGSAPDAHDVGIIFDRTDGVPFFIEELVKVDGTLNVECVPATLRDILLVRYESLTEPTQKVLRLLAAGGARVEHELLSEVYDASSEQAAADDIDRAAREAVVASVLVVDGTAYAFRHALVREAIHEELLPGERVRFHTRYAEALEGRAGPADATAISYHWMAAHNVGCAFASAVTAMRQARAAYAFATAARMGERALELWSQVPDAETVAGSSRVDLLADTAYILRNVGESERAVALVDEAIASSSPAEPELYARLLRDKASYLANLGQTGSVELLRQALLVLQGRPPSVLRANVLGELAARLMLSAHFEQAVDVADEGFREAREADSRARMSVAANIRGFSRVSLGDIDRGLADLALAGELAEGSDSARLRYWVNQSDAMNLLGRYEEAIRFAEEGTGRARERGVERTSGAMLMSNVIGPLFCLGRTERANELLDRALELDPPIGFSAHLQRLKLRTTLWGGDAVQAERLLRGWRAALSVQLQVEAQSRLGLAAIAAEIALERGNVREAWAEVSGILGPGYCIFSAYDLPVLAVAARTLAAIVATGTVIERGVSEGGVSGGTGAGGDTIAGEGGFDPAAAERRLRDILGQSSGWPTAPAYLAIVDAELGGPGRTGTDPELWDAAVAASAAATVPAQLSAYTLLRHAESLALSGDRVAARDRAQEARERAEEIGAGLITAHVLELERRIGAIGPANAGSVGAGSAAGGLAGGAGLTEREQQVLDLLAQGLSNRQIAERLFISSKTASVHVSSILRKTGASTRTEAAYLAR